MNGEINTMYDPSRIERKILDRVRKIVGEKDLKHMIRLFLINAPKKLESAFAGLKAGNYKEVAAAAHSLISSAGTLGATGMQKMAAKVEFSAGNKEEDVPQFLLELQKSYDKIKPTLEKERKSLESRP